MPHLPPPTPCTHQWSIVAPANPGREFVLTCVGGDHTHVGPHRDPSGVYWSGHDWLEQLNQWRADPTTPAQDYRAAKAELDPDIAHFDTNPLRPPRPWESLTVDGCVIPGRLVLESGFTVDMTTGHVTMTLRSREGISVQYQTVAGVVSPEPQVDYFNGPVTLDWDHTPTYALQLLPHIHDVDGVCRKRRDGQRCDPPAPRPGVAE